MVKGDRGPICGLLNWLDIVMFWGGSPLLAASKALDAVVVAVLPNRDMAADPNNMRLIAYESVIDLLVAANNAGVDWLAAHGVPRDKICMLPCLYRIGDRRTSRDPAHDPTTAGNEQARQAFARSFVERIERLVAARQLPVANC